VHSGGVVSDAPHCAVRVVMEDEISVASFRGNWEIKFLNVYFSSVTYHFAALMKRGIVPGEKVLFLVLEPLWVCY
jgi:hypothetical protein